MKVKSLGLMWVTLIGVSFVIKVFSDPVALDKLGERPTRRPIVWPYWPMKSPIGCG
jgi:hypothetical protein